MRNRLNSYLLIAFVILFGGVSWTQTTYPVSWENLLKTTFTSPNLQRQSGASGTGTATSENLLYGGEVGDRFFIKRDGFIIYTPANNNQSKKLGFSITASEKTEATNTIDYGFSFQTNGKVKAYTADESSAAVDYSANQQLKISRDGELMSYFVNGVLILQVKVDMAETLILRAELTSNNSSFNDVRVSFDTKRLIVDPLIDNTQSTIKMLITGGFPPFEYTWEDGHTLKYPDAKIEEKKFSKGLHPLKIRDAHNLFTERAFLLGDDVTWTNFDNTQQTTNILSKTNGNNWGDAQSTTTLGKNDLFWIQYVADVQQVSKAFGVSFININVNNYNDLEAGFLLLKENQLQIIYHGNVIMTTEYNNRDALLLTREGKTMRWMINGKEVYEESNINFTLDLKIAGLLKESIATLKAINFYKLDATPITAFWDDTKLTGSVEVKITYLTNATGPFHYYISQEPIAPLYEMYKFARDSIFTDTIGGGLDSLLFFEGNAAQLAIDAANQVKTNQLSLLKEHTFENLENGDYYITVFDKTGFPIHSGQIRVAPALTMYNTDGITQDVQTSVFTSTKANAKTDLNYYIDDELAESRLDFQIITTNEKYDVGLSDFDATTSAIKYGFALNKNNSKKVNFIVNGAVQTTTYNVKKNNILSLEKIDGELLYKINGITMFTTPLTGTYLYKAQLLLSQPGLLFPVIQPLIVAVKILPLKKQTIKLYKLNTVINNASCSDNSTSLAFTFFKKTTLNTVPFQYNYTLANLMDNQQTPITGSSLTGQSIAISDLPFGVYRMHGTITAVGTTSPIIAYINETICVGIEAQFDPLNHYALSPNSYSLNRNNNSINPLDYASALSLNTLTANQTGFVSFTPSHPSKFNVNYFSFNADYSTGLPNGMYMEIYRISPTMLRYNFYSNGLGVFSRIFMDNVRITAQINATSIRFFANYSGIISTIPRPPGDLHIKALTRHINNGFKDVFFSFGCFKQGIDQLGYSKVKRELDASFCNAVDGKVKFVLDEEYNIQNGKYIPIKLYSDKHKLLGEVNFDGTVTEDLTPLAYHFEDNRYTLQINSDSEVTIGKYYFLEFTNSKNQKRYLKFYYKN